jgi:hypothetical protein
MAAALAVAASSIAVLASSAGPEHPITAVPVRAVAVAPVGPLLSADMRRPSEKLPHGVPTSYDWATGPRVRDTTRARQFTALTGWGQVYRCATSTRTTSRPVELKGLETWVLRRSTRRWVRVQRSSLVNGAAFPEDFHGSAAPANFLRHDEHGTTVRMRAGRNFHFWPSGPRATVPVADVQAVTVMVRGRIALERGAGRPCLVLSVGADFWRDATAGADGFRNSADAGIGRFKRLGGTWRLFTMTSASAAVLAAHPFPVRVSSAELR